MHLCNGLLVTRDNERSMKFYHDVVGLELVLDNDGNMILTEGLVLQDEKSWKEFMGRLSILRTMPRSYTVRKQT